MLMRKTELTCMWWFGERAGVPSKHTGLHMPDMPSLVPSHLKPWNWHAQLNSLKHFTAAFHSLFEDTIHFRFLYHLSQIVCRSIFLFVSCAPEPLFIKPFKIFKKMSIQKALKDKKSFFFFKMTWSSVIHLLKQVDWKPCNKGWREGGWSNWSCPLIKNSNFEVDAARKGKVLLDGKCWNPVIFSHKGTICSKIINKSSNQFRGPGSQLLPTSFIATTTSSI